MEKWRRKKKKKKKKAEEKSNSKRNIKKRQFEIECNSRSNECAARPAVRTKPEVSSGVCVSVTVFAHVSMVFRRFRSVLTKKLRFSSFDGLDFYTSEEKERERERERESEGNACEAEHERTERLGMRRPELRGTVRN
jgi:hypothetical protein